MEGIKNWENQEQPKKVIVEKQVEEISKYREDLEREDPEKEDEEASEDGNNEES
ncbi:MAG: hypothetical protein ACD_9C00212G0001 [uncultured bacterium]|nr:MAG: hypothetical protein ACD_9C00212G0001 [uncultured bacterium]